MNAAFPLFSGSKSRKKLLTVFLTAQPVPLSGLVSLAGLRSRRKERQDFVFLPNRNGRFDKAIGPAGILDNVCISHITWRIAQKKCGCFFESSVPIRKRLCDRSLSR
jgi:hypothetical protein